MDLQHRAAEFDSGFDKNISKQISLLEQLLGTRFGHAGRVLDRQTINITRPGLVLGLRPDLNQKCSPEVNELSVQSKKKKNTKQNNSSNQQVEDKNCVYFSYAAWGQMGT